jgi:hypothetical protein
METDMSTTWTYPENMSKKTEFLDMLFFPATEQIQKLRVQKNQRGRRFHDSEPF